MMAEKKRSSWQDDLRMSFWAVLSGVVGVFVLVVAVVRLCNLGGAGGLVGGIGGLVVAAALFGCCVYFCRAMVKQARQEKK